MRMLSFKSSNAVLAGEGARVVPLDGGGGRGGGGAVVLRREVSVALESPPNRSPESPNRPPVAGAPKSATKGFGAPGAACTKYNLSTHFVELDTNLNIKLRETHYDSWGQHFIVMELF